MSGLPHKFVLFIDRNSGGRTFRALIENQGVAVKLHDEYFSMNTEDPDWLREVGERGWIMITGDAKVTRAPLFLSTLTRTTARVFILKELNGATPEGKAQCVISHYERIVSICQTHKAPLLWKINKDGSLREIDFRKHLHRMKRHQRS
jgi:PIN like domain